MKTLFITAILAFSGIALADQCSPKFEANYTTTFERLETWFYNGATPQSEANAKESCHEVKKEKRILKFISCTSTDGQQLRGSDLVENCDTFFAILKELHRIKARK